MCTCLEGHIKSCLCCCDAATIMCLLLSIVSPIDYSIVIFGGLVKMMKVSVV